MAENVTISRDLARKINNAGRSAALATGDLLVVHRLTDQGQPDMRLVPESAIAGGADVSAALALKANITGLAAGTVPVGFAAADFGTGSVARTAVGMFADQTLSIKTFGAVGDGVADDSDAIELALNKLAATTLETGGTLRIPANTIIRITRPIEIRATSDTRANYLQIVGDNLSTAKIYADFTTGDALKIFGRNVSIENLTISASASRTSGGTGAGIYGEYSVGTPYYMGRARFRNIIVTGQPGHGIHLQSPELARFDDVDCESNGGSGLFVEKYSLAVAGAFQLIAIGLRCRFNTAHGIRLNDTPAGATFMNCESYSNAATSQIYVAGGRSCHFINCDVEDQVSSTTPDSVGLVLLGSDHIVQGGHWASLTKAVDLQSATDCHIQGLYATNESAGVAMTAIVAQDASSFRNVIDLKELTSAELTSRNITTSHTNAATSTVAMVRRRGGLMEASNFTSRVLAVAYASAVAFNTDNNGIFVVGALTNNITISNPSGGTSRSGQVWMVSLLQDGTGGRTIAWGVNFETTMPTASGTANQSKTIAVWYDGSAAKWKLLSDSGWH